MNVQTEIVRGDVISAEGYELIPVVQQTCGRWQKATIGTHFHGASGGGFLHLRPLGLIVQQGEKEHMIPIPDPTRQMLLGIVLAAIAVPVLLLIGVQLARK
ncbi:MAG: hypothetical protein JW900_04250 [Anaerolineae bacterium]|nr:hypothetical protein [Anaerolineae bacterium]